MVDPFDGLPGGLVARIMAGAMLMRQATDHRANARRKSPGARPGLLLHIQSAAHVCRSPLLNGGSGVHHSCTEE
jgi:hypothetical protein